MWNKAAGNGKGHGGIMVLVREKEGRFIQLEKEDPNKQFVWLKISENGNHIRIAACYFAPQVSKIYKNRGLDHKDPFAALKTDIAIYSQLGEVLIVGDFNARTAGEQASILCCKEDSDPIWLTEESNHQWERISEDKGCNFFGEQLLTLCGAFDLVICNGMTRWEKSGNFTCNTYNGASVVDYAICSHNLCGKMEEMLIGDQIWDLKSDHKPIYLSFSWTEKKQLGSKTQCVQQNPPNGRILLTPENCNTFKKMLERLFEKEEISFHGLHSHRLTHLIQSALAECKRAKIKKSKTNCFPVNAWFDEECKKARRRWKESDKDNIKLKAYQQIVRKKKADFMVSRREELIFLGKNNPKLFWKELQPKKVQTENNITAAKWFDYARQLYEQDPKVDPPPLVNIDTKLFTEQEVEMGIKRLGAGKAKDLDELQVEYLKWGLKFLSPHITKIFNNIIQQGFPTDWTTSMAIPLFKSGDVNNPSNYRTIMINPLFAKLFGSMLEKKISKWAEERDKRAKGQAGFRPKHSTVDHCITLRHIIEKAWEEKEEVFCCFVDFRKAFDTVPRDKLWSRMEELGVPRHLRAAVHRMYEEVKVKIRTSAGISESFRSDIGVKQGCPLSPTLFGLYIDKLEEWLNSQGGDGIHLGKFVIRLLLYADDLILIAKSTLGLQEHLCSLEQFCRRVGMQVNISKTKVVVFSNKRKHNQHKFYFEGNILEEVADYKYLGIDFSRNLSWDGCRKKRTLGGWKAFYSFQNRCREAELWDWKTTLTLFGLLVIPVILYGCELWASSTTDMQWKQIEKIQKRLITNKFKIKSAVPYDILLSETGAAPIEAIAMVRVIRYLKKIEQMEEGRWPKVVFSDRLCKRKKTWMRQNNKWFSKWGICLSMCPTKSKEIKTFVMDKFHKRTWEKELGRKKKYYIEEFNPTHNHQQKAYIGANISWRSKILIAQLRTNSHQLRCETGRWKRPKERWEERVCILCSSGKVETEKHFILECEAFKDSRENYAGILGANSWDNLFSKEYVEKLGAIIVKLHRKRAEYKSQMENQSVP